MAPAARMSGTSPAGHRVAAGGAKTASTMPAPSAASSGTDAETGLSVTAAAILARAASGRRGRRVLVGGARAVPVSRLLCGILSDQVRCIWLDLTPGGGAGNGLSCVLDGTVQLSRAILSREGGFDRMHGGPGHPDGLVDRPHGLAIVLEALSFAYEVVLISAPERDESLVAEVLASVSDDAVLAGAAETPAERDEAMSYAARGAGRVGIIAADGRVRWLAVDELQASH